MNAADTWGLMAEYRTDEALLAAARAAYQAGYRRAEAYAPYAVEGLADALGHHGSSIPALTLAGGIVGGAGAYFLQWYSAVRSYPENIAGRPLDSWPEFIPVTFEVTVLFAAVVAFVASLVCNGLPRLSHPVFDAPDFELASRNRFFLVLPVDDPAFDFARARELLAATDPLRTAQVAR